MAVVAVVQSLLPFAACPAKRKVLGNFPVPSGTSGPVPSIQPVRTGRAWKSFVRRRGLEGGPISLGEAFPTGLSAFFSARESRRGTHQSSDLAVSGRYCRDSFLVSGRTPAFCFPGSLTRGAQAWQSPY